jgi:hypothetical protein
MIRVTIVAGIVVLAGLIALVAIGFHQALEPLVGAGLLVFLIGAGNLLYGKDSHGAAAQARKRPELEAHYRAIDEARQLALQGELDEELTRREQQARRQARAARDDGGPA